MPEEDKTSELAETDGPRIVDQPDYITDETGGPDKVQEMKEPEVEPPVSKPDAVETAIAIESLESDASIIEELAEEAPVDADTDVGSDAEVVDEGVVAESMDLPEFPQDRMEYVAETVFTLSEKLSSISTALSFVTTELQKASDETAQIVEWSRSTRLVRPFSNLFLVISVLLLLLIAAGTGYLAVNQLQLQARQDQISELVVQAVDNLHKREVAMDKQFATLIGSEIRQEREVISKEAVQSKLNRMRDGSAELRLLRKSNGDWLLPKGKTEELLTDHELIELLNQLYEKSGKSLNQHTTLPPHKVVILLKPDGKGGTGMTVTQETLP